MVLAKSKAADRRTVRQQREQQMSMGFGLPTRQAPTDLWLRATIETLAVGSFWGLSMIRTVDYFQERSS